MYAEEAETSLLALHTSGIPNPQPYDAIHQLEAEMAKSGRQIQPRFLRAPYDPEVGARMQHRFPCFVSLRSALGARPVTHIRYSPVIHPLTRSIDHQVSYFRVCTPTRSLCACLSTSTHPHILHIHTIPFACTHCPTRSRLPIRGQGHGPCADSGAAQCRQDHESCRPSQRTSQHRLHDSTNRCRPSRPRALHGRSGRFNYERWKRKCARG